MRMTSNRSPGRQRGFTLTELFAVVAVAAVLAAAAFPNLQEFIKNNTRSTRMNTLVTALNYARSDAVTRRRTTVVCPTTDNATCAGDNQFHTGLLVISGATVIRVFRMDTSANFTFLGALSGASPPPPLNQVSFGPAGRATGVANARFVYCDDREAAGARAVILSATGHPSVSTDSDNDGIHDVNGANLQCP